MTELTLIMQIVAMASGFVIKPAYMTLMLYTIWHLHRKAGHDLRILQYGIAVFLVGESFCTLNYLFFGDESHLMDWGHGFAMAVGLGIIVLGFICFFDERMIFYSASGKRCAFAGFCRSCRKYSEVSCGLEKIFMFIALALSTVSLMPLLSPLVSIRQEVIIFGKKTLYYYPIIEQVFDLRIYPVAAFALLVTSAVILWVVKDSPVRYAKYPFVFGIGFFIFSFFRYVLLYCYKDQVVWRVFWEEFTELLLIVGILVFLFTFSEQLKRNAATVSK